MKDSFPIFVLWTSLYSSCTADANEMLGELNKSGTRMEPRINRRRDIVHEGRLLRERRNSIGRLSATETSSYVDHGQSMNMGNNMKDELDGRRSAAGAAFGPLKETVEHKRDPELQTKLFYSKALPDSCYVDVG